MKILVIEDDYDFSELIAIYLKRENWQIDVFNESIDGLVAFKNEDYDLIILDIMLDDINGFELLKKIRESSIIPVIMLTALEDSTSKVKSFGLGADDYMIKPFEPKELIARIKAHFRRNYEFLNNHFLDKTDYLHIGKLKINTNSHECFYDDKKIDLAPKEFEILTLLAKSPQRIHSMEEIHQKVRNEKLLDTEVNPVMVHVRRIRRKFEMIGVNSIIKTVWKVGYKINV